MNAVSWSATTNRYPSLTKHGRALWSEKLWNELIHVCHHANMASTSFSVATIALTLSFELDPYSEIITLAYLTFETMCYSSSRFNANAVFVHEEKLSDIVDKHFFLIAEIRMSWLLAALTSRTHWFHQVLVRLSKIETYLHNVFTWGAVFFEFSWHCLELFTLSHVLYSSSYLSPIDAKSIGSWMASGFSVAPDAVIKRLNFYYQYLHAKSKLVASSSAV